MAIKAKTGGRIAKLASKLLTSKAAAKTTKKVAGSALTHAVDKKKAAVKKTVAKKK